MIRHKAILLLKFALLQILKATYKGDYSGLPEAWRHVNQNSGRTWRGNVAWEQYAKDPSTEPNPDEWITEIFIPVN
jgi:effector-binding domain-containing protein